MEEQSNKREKKFFFVLAFLIMISLPMLLGIIAQTCSVHPDVEMNGYMEKEQIPELNKESFLNGSYQTKIASYFNNHFNPRGILIKTYNSLQYCLFKESDIMVIGKNNDLFTQDYIDAELCINGKDFSRSGKSESLDTMASQMADIDKKLERFDKQLLIWITPSKAKSNRDNIPYRSSIQTPENGVRGIDCLIKLLDKYSVPYYDSNTLLFDLDYPPYYSTGIHWSRTFEQIAVNELIDRLSKETGYYYKKAVINEAKASATPFQRDDDLQALLNLWFDEVQNTYYQYDVAQEYPSEYKPLRILLQGGSFADRIGYNTDLLYTDDNIDYINYSYYLEKDGVVLPLDDDLNKLPMGECLDRADCVVIEINEMAVSGKSGFVEYLCDFLDDYQPSRRERQSAEYISFDETVKWSEKAVNGAYGKEDTGCWIANNAFFALQDEQIAEKGLDISINVPEQLFQLDRIKHDIVYIYVNGVKQYEHEFFEAWGGTIHIPPEQLPPSLDGVEGAYDIVIAAEESFCPYTEGLSEDNRDLAIWLRYLGRAN